MEPQKRIFLYPYQIYSESARALQNEFISRNITCRRCRENREYLIGQPKYNTIVNWGNSEWPMWLSHKREILNPPHKVKDACNKKTTFSILNMHRTSYVPEFTDNILIAQRWLYDGVTVVVRNKLKGSGGEGIQIIAPEDKKKIPVAPLYVQYIPKVYEFRVHVFGDVIIDVQQKKKSNAVDLVNTKIRNHANGWIFSREDMAAEAESYTMRKIAVDAVRRMQLDFGAVDIIYNNKEDMFYILEINTAPGLEGATVKLYADAILKY